MVIQVWKIPINSQRSDFSSDAPEKFKPSKAEHAKQFCFREGWVGIGWGIDGLFFDLDEQEKYVAALRDPPGKVTFAADAAIGPSNAFAHRVQDGDFVWCRASGDVYWLGKVIGPWGYRYNGDFDRFDLFQVRKCEWHCVGPSDLVPGPVKNAYAGRGRTVSRILAEGEAALLGSALIWKSKTGESVQFDREPSSDFPLGAIGHDDLEDIVALYLQIEMGWHIVPSTVKKSTPTTEFVLRNRIGNRAYIQIKSGQSGVDTNEIIVPDDVDKFFIFFPMIDKINASLDHRVVHLAPKDIVEFAKTNRELMPSFVKQLLN